MKNKYNIEPRKVKVTIEQTKWIGSCPKCKNPISGINYETALRNIESHLIKCKKEKKK
jgi:hypothetical protein